MPRSPEVADTLGFVYMKKGLARQAIAAFKEAHDAEPGRAAFRYHLGLAYAKEGQFSEARPLLDSALKSEPDAAEAAEARAALNRMGALGS
jgi:predicted Zn-dependent protease